MLQLYPNLNMRTFESLAAQEAISATMVEVEEEVAIVQGTELLEELLRVELKLLRRTQRMLRWWW